MLIDAKDHRIRNDIESEPEVRVPPTIGEGIDLDDFLAVESAVCMIRCNRAAAS